jgi:hypothetical protein
MTMGMLLIILLVVAVLAMSSWGYSSYAYRPATTVVEEPVAGPSPIITIIGVLGLIALVAFFILWAVEGWHFNFEAIPPR